MPLYVKYSKLDLFAGLWLSPFKGEPCERAIETPALQKLYIYILRYRFIVLLVYLQLLEA